MNIPDEFNKNDNVLEEQKNGKFGLDDSMIQVLSEKEQKALEEKETKELEEATAKMNKDAVKANINSFKSAVKSNDKAKLKGLKTYFEEVLDCLGHEPKGTIEGNIASVNANIRDGGATSLRVATLKNEQAKLAIFDYKPVMKNIVAEIDEMKLDEAIAVAPVPVQPVNTDDKQDKRATGVIMACVAGLVASTIALCGFARGCSKTSKETTGSSDSITSYSDDSTYEPTTVHVTTSTGDYSVETETGYTSPTRETTDPNNNDNNDNNNSNGNNGVEPGATTSNIRNTTPNDHESVISQPTNGTTAKPSEGTSSVQTDVNGTQPGHTEPEVAPTGTDPLSEEPTRVTVDRTADPTPTPKPTESTPAPTEGTTAKPTEGTTKPADPTPTPKPATPTPKPVPIETVDPDDEANVIEKTKNKKTTPKATTKSTTVATVDPDNEENVKTKAVAAKILTYTLGN